MTPERVTPLTEKIKEMQRIGKMLKDDWDKLMAKEDKSWFDECIEEMYDMFIESQKEMHEYFLKQMQEKFDKVMAKLAKEKKYAPSKTIPMEPDIMPSVYEAYLEKEKYTFFTRPYTVEVVKDILKEKMDSFNEIEIVNFRTNEVSELFEIAVIKNKLVIKYLKR